MISATVVLIMLYSFIYKQYTSLQNKPSYKRIKSTKSVFQHKGPLEAIGEAAITNDIYSFQIML